MKSLFTGKVWIILLVFAELIGLIVLSSGLNDVKFDAPNMVKLDNFFRLIKPIINRYFNACGQAYGHFTYTRHGGGCYLKMINR